MVASYVVQSRSNSNLQLAGIIDDYASLDLLLRYNDVSEWTMTIDRKSSHLANLIPASPLGAAGNGIVVTRDYGNGTPAVILSGPITHIDYQMSSQLVTLKGFDDTIWLKWRRADTWPASYPYATLVNSLSPAFYWRLADTSGTTAADASGNGKTGTYNGGFSLSQASLIDDVTTSASFNGTSGYLSITPNPIAGNDFTLILWLKTTATTSATARNTGPGIATAFTAGVTSDWGAGLVTGGFIHAGTGNPDGEASTTTPINDGLPHCFAFRRVKATGVYTLFTDGVLEGTGTGGTQTLNASSVLNIGRQNETANLWLAATFEEVVGFNSALTDAQILNIAQTGRSRLAYVASDNRNGQASTTMLSYVNVNAVATLASRVVPLLALAADPAIGGQVKGVARCDELLIILQGLALQSGDNVGFKITQTLNVGTNTLSCSIYAPRDQTSNAVFSTEIGNLLDYSYSIDYPTMNELVTGGAGQSSSRAFLEGQDSASISTYGRIEGFLNGAASNDYLTMKNGIAANLLQTAAQTNLSITPVDTAGLMYQRDYGVGDKITCYLEGLTVQDKVREVRITLSKTGGGAPDEVVTPALGQQGLAAASDSLIAQAFSALTRNIQRANKRIARIEQNQ